jgi:glycosyltransferase involved in cell wall biosynthesis
VTSNILYLAPTLPCPRRSGLSQRAYHLCRALSRHGPVHLAYLRPHIVPRSREDFSPLGFLASVTALPPMPLLDPVYLAKRLLFTWPSLWNTAIQRIPEWRFFSQIALWRLRRHLKDVPIALVFAQRLYTLCYAAVAPDARVILDLDDWESVTRGRLATLAQHNGMLREQRIWAKESRSYEMLERESLPRMNRILVCSDLDSVGLRKKHGELPITVLPNIVSMGDAREPAAKAEPGELLFVGSFGYFPNWDAAVYATRSLLSHLPGCRLNLVGREWVKLPKDVLEHPRVQVLGEVDDLRPLYCKASLALVPIRAGGGTRIKVLESMAFGCPVVATPMGTEGLEVTHGRELLIGSTDTELIACCRALLESASMQDRLSRTAYEWVTRHHQSDRWVPIFDKLMRGSGLVH